MFGTNPLFLEASVDACHPVAEGLVSMALVSALNLVNVLYLAVPVSKLGCERARAGLALAACAATAFDFVVWQLTSVCLASRAVFHAGLPGRAGRWWCVPRCAWCCGCPNSVKATTAQTRTTW
jgi:hypothetical protein